MRTSSLTSRMIAKMAIAVITATAYAGDVPAPGFNDLDSTQLSDLALLVSASDPSHPKISFRVNDRRMVIADAILAARAGAGSPFLAAAQLVGLLREANYVSIKTRRTDRKDSMGLPIVEVTDVGIHLSK